MAQMASGLVQAAPNTVVIISPHGPVFQDAIAVHVLKEIEGDFGAFGAPEVAFHCPVDRELGVLVMEQAELAGIAIAAVTPDRAAKWGAEALDHGTMVPLYYLKQAGWNGPILPIAMGLLPPLELYQFGEALQRAIDKSGRRIAVLASGDLSHRLTPAAPAGYHPEAHKFDEQVVELLQRGDLARLFALDHELCETAGECGLRPLMMLAGTLDGLKIEPQVLSYEGPFGVGYAVASIRPAGPEPGRRLRKSLEQTKREQIATRRAEAHPIVALARTALEHYVKTGMRMDFSTTAPEGGTASWQLPPGIPEQAGVFVSLKLEGSLRGCMGTTAPTEPTLAMEVVSNAIMAGTDDPRFPAVTESELPYIDYSVDVLQPAEPCTREQLDPARYGVIVEKGHRRGLLLPDLPGVDTASEQVRIACDKAGLRASEPDLKLYRFRVDRYR
jgi:AmmeMemoRadiSam system protein A/AmmeMemoRadiSam system protein B